MTMTNAVVLIEAERDALSSTGGCPCRYRGCSRGLLGDRRVGFRCDREGAGPEQLADVVTVEIGGLSGVTRTQTMVAFAAYSRHDLESLFSIGE